MNTREWALVAFTLLMQASVGILVTVVVLQATGGKNASPARPTVFAIPAGVALAAGVAALLASLLHLGRPLHAWLAVNNVATSWLSREIVLAAVFVAATGVYAGLAAREPLGAPARYASWVSALVGCAAIAAMAGLYMVPSQPVWNRVLTPAGFFVTSLLFGVGVVVALGGGRTAFAVAPAVERTIAYVAIVLIVVQTVLLPSNLAVLPSEPAAAVPVVAAGWAQALAWVSLLAGLAALAILVRAVRQSPYVAMLFSPFAAGMLLVLIAVASVAGRLLFYAAAVDLRGSAGPPL
ncbi:MAG: dimethyl sulfoxide reductase anchor subunit family protein [Bacteroidales bacterium]